MKKIILLSVLLSFPLCATVAPIVPGQSLWWIVKRIGLSVDTIESKVDLIDTSTTQNACGVVDISSADVVGGTLAISTPGSYCLTEDITADVTIGSSSVSLSLSGRRVTGTVQINSGSYINVSNGFVTPPQPTGSDPAGIDVAVGVSKLFIDNVVVECTDSGAGAGVDGRDAMSMAADDVQIRNCTFIAGAGGDATNPSGIGGDGVVLTTDASDVLLVSCVIIGGDAGVSSTSSGKDGGHGIAIAGATDVIIELCTIFRAGDGGNGSLGGGDGGHGIACITSGADNVFIKNCTIQKSGSGGTGSSSTGGNAGDGIFIASTSNAKIAVSNCIISDMGSGGTGSTSFGGVGGNGVSIGSSNTDISVHHCTISNAGAGGSGLTPGAGGKAVADAVPAGAGGSKVFANMAHDIANSIRYDLQGITSVEAGFDVSNPPTSTAVNLYANVFM